MTERQVLDQKRKWLGEHLKEVTESYVLLLHHHLVRIENVSSYVTDGSKDRKVNGFSSYEAGEPLSLEMEVEELEKLNLTYKKR